MKKAALLLAILLLTTLVYSYIKKTAHVDETTLSNEKDISVVVTSFGSKNIFGKWTGEAAPYMRNLQNNKDVTDKFPTCTHVFTGTLYDHDVMIVIAGMAKVRMSSCITSILHISGEQIKEVILTGIAGITPMKGGMIDSSGNIRNDDRAMIGDVCINSAAFDFDLQRYSSDQKDSNQPQPKFWLPDDENPANKVIGNTDLAKDLYQASLQVSWPDPPLEVEETNMQYHRTSRKPKQWGPHECLEVTDDLFWHDVRADAQARKIGANWISSVYKKPISENDIVITTSMEAIPVGKVIEWWNSAKGTNISYAYIRGASNFNHAPVNENGTPKVDGRESLEDGYSKSTVEFAVETEALPVLKYFELKN